ncbi:hypothetical protein AVEN_41923-1 [Araneus ventricosus]|uniref:Uncharacterized protein n=1 Tax=Araneus ventricosus TaxID=182803 RepID=A0A4Y2ACK5_ARAVE|nr:hypothetical protein AVEN_41923-1 [Araneus ventricosus]
MSSSTEAGVLIVITDHGPTPPEGGTYYHWWRVTRPPLLKYPPGKREPAYLSGGLSSVYSWCPPLGRTVKPDQKTWITSALPKHMGI